MAELLDLPVSRGRLHAIAGARLLDAGQLERALALAGLRATRAIWARALPRHALIVGVVLLVAGTIYFVAANWSALSGVARMVSVGVPMMLAFGAGAVLGDTLPGRAATLLGGLLFGPLLAVVGQVYQTGADAWQLFAWWTLVLVVSAVLSRFSGTWISALLGLHVATFAWIDQELGRSPYEGVGAWIVAGLALLDACLVALAEWRASGIARRVLVHVTASFGLVSLLPLALVALIDEPSEGSLPGLLVLVGALAAMWATYRWRRPEVGMLAIFAGVVTILTSSLLGRILLIEAEMQLFGVALLGLLVCAQVWGLTRWLLDWRREQGAA
jgi:uncharacterized membrane protein